MSIITVILVLLLLSSASAYLLKIYDLQQRSVATRFVETQAGFLADVGVLIGEHYIMDPTLNTITCPTTTPFYVPSSAYAAFPRQTFLGFSITVSISCIGRASGASASAYGVKSVVSFGDSSDWPSYVSRTKTSAILLP